MHSYNSNNSNGSMYTCNRIGALWSGAGRVGVVNTCPRARRTNVYSAIPNQCSPAADDEADMVVQDATEPEADNDDDGDDDVGEFAAAVARCARQMAL